VSAAADQRKPIAVHDTGTWPSHVCGVVLHNAARWPQPESLSPTTSSHLCGRGERARARGPLVVAMGPLTLPSPDDGEREQQSGSNNSMQRGRKGGVSHFPPRVMESLMPKLTIDDHPIEVAPGSTLLEAAESLGIEIPTLCLSERL